MGCGSIEIINSISENKINISLCDLCELCVRFTNNQNTKGYGGELINFS